MTVSSLNALVNSSVLKSESGGGGGGGVNPDDPLVLNSTLKVGSYVGFNGVDPVEPATIGGDASSADIEGAVNLINQLRSALVNTGIVIVGGG